MGTRNPSRQEAPPPNYQRYSDELGLLERTAVQRAAVITTDETYARIWLIRDQITRRDDKVVNVIMAGINAGLNVAAGVYEKLKGQKLPFTLTSATYSRRVDSGRCEGGTLVESPEEEAFLQEGFHKVRCYH